MKNDSNSPFGFFVVRLFVNVVISFVFFYVIGISCSVVRKFNAAGMWMPVKGYPKFIEYLRVTTAYPLGQILNILTLMVFGRNDPDFFHTSVPGYIFIGSSGK
jgi:choline-glycine betaine transporter